MFEADLVASHAAVAHLLGEVSAGKCLYTPGNVDGVQSIQDREKEIRRIAALMERTCISAEAELRGHWRTDPGDWAARLGEFLAEIRVGGNTWRIAREWIGRGLLSGSTGIQQTLRFSEALSRSVDNLFFSPDLLAPNPWAGVNPGQPGASLTDGTSVHDAHVHVGGSVTWDVLWCWLMTGRYPIWRYSKDLYTRLVSRDEFQKLLGKGAELRKDLSRIFSLQEWWALPSFESSLYRRVYGTGAADSPEVRDYVLVRSIARREMIVGEVEDLTEYTGVAWKRFWGSSGLAGLAQKLGTGGAGVWWNVLLKREEQVEELKWRAAADHMRNLGVRDCALRANAEWPPNRLAMQLRRVEVALAGSGYGAAFHGSRPGPKLDEDERDSALTKWKRQVEVICDLDPEATLVRAFDLAGPERETRIDWFQDAVVACIGGDRAITIHAGEDFHDPWNGLQRVYLAVAAAKQFQEVDRLMRALAGVAPRSRRPHLHIGHGSVLGINPYSLKWSGPFLCPVWARAEAIEFILNFGSSVFGSRWLEIREYALARRGRLPTASRSTGQDTPQVLVDPRPIEQHAFRIAQRHVIERCKDISIVIESNPTSNLRVLGAPSYALVPFWGLIAAGLDVAIGSDNPGIMKTHVEEEISRLYAADSERRELEGQQPERFSSYIREPWGSPVALGWQEIEARLRLCTAGHAGLGRMSCSFSREELAP